MNFDYFFAKNSTPDEDGTCEYMYQHSTDWCFDVCVCLTILCGSMNLSIDG